MYALKDSPLILSDDEQADMYLCMVEELRRYGYEQYEISISAYRAMNPGII